MPKMVGMNPRAHPFQHGIVQDFFAGMRMLQELAELFERRRKMQAKEPGQGGVGTKVFK